MARGWGRSWLAEEDDLLRHAYAHGDSLAPLRQRLGRSRALDRLSRRRTRPARHARATERLAHRAALDQRTRSPSCAANTARCRHRNWPRGLGRKKGGVFNKAWTLGLKHGYIRPFGSDEEAGHPPRPRARRLADRSQRRARPRPRRGQQARHPHGHPVRHTRDPGAARTAVGRSVVTLDTILALDGRQPTNLPTTSRRGSRARQPLPARHAA